MNHQYPIRPVRKHKIETMLRLNAPSAVTRLNYKEPFYFENIGDLGVILALYSVVSYCMLSFICNYVVSIQRGFLFLLVLGMACIILLWQSLGLPYNYYPENGNCKML